MGIEHQSSDSGHTPECALSMDSGFMCSCEVGEMPSSNPMDDPLIAYVHRVIGEAARDFGGVARISAGKLAVLVQMLADRTDEIERLRAALDRIRRESAAQVNGSTHYEGCAVHHPHCRILAFVQDALRPCPPFAPIERPADETPAFHCGMSQCPGHRDLRDVCDSARVTGWEAHDLPLTDDVAADKTASETPAVTDPLNVALRKLSMCIGNPALEVGKHETMESALVDEARRYIERAADKTSAGRCKHCGLSQESCTVWLARYNASGACCPECDHT